jgi:hypothetical protein
VHAKEAPPVMFQLALCHEHIADLIETASATFSRDRV